MTRQPICIIGVIFSWLEVIISVRINTETKNYKYIILIIFKSDLNVEEGLGIIKKR